MNLTNKIFWTVMALATITGLIVLISLNAPKDDVTSSVLPAQTQVKTPDMFPEEMENIKTKVKNQIMRNFSERTHVSYGCIVKFFDLPNHSYDPDWLGSDCVVELTSHKSEVEQASAELKRQADLATGREQ